MPFVFDCLAQDTCFDLSDDDDDGDDNDDNNNVFILNKIT